MHLKTRLPKPRSLDAMGSDADGQPNNTGGGGS